MLNWLNPYILGGAVLGAALLVGGSYWWGYDSGKDSVLTRLKDDRITILQDGKRIDEEILDADDDALCALLGGCVPDE